MSFIGNIFKKKPGGTTVGNLLRGAANSVTGGILGNGSALAKWEASPEGQAAILSAATGAAGAAGANANPGLSNAINGALGGALGSPAGKQLIGQGLKAWLSLNKWAYWVGAGVVVGIIILVKKAFTGNQKTRRKY